MFALLKKWYEEKTAAFKMKLIIRWTEPNGLTLVRIVRRAGTDYILDSKGALHRIGRR